MPTIRIVYLAQHPAQVRQQGRPPAGLTQLLEDWLGGELRQLAARHLRQHTLHRHTQLVHADLLGAVAVAVAVAVKARMVRRGGGHRQ